MRDSFGFFLFKGDEREPELFCGLCDAGLPIFAPPKHKRLGNSSIYRPVLFWAKADALLAWKDIEDLGEKVTLMQICDGYYQFMRTPS